jgi:hypothetical protein
MKVVVEDGNDISWKDHYAVLATGFLLIYKEGINKSSGRVNKHCE